MQKLFNRKDQKILRQKLRNQKVLSEKLLWKKLQKKQLGYKLRRQHGIGDYIVDFYCPKLKLAIELDGGTHVSDSAIKYDNKRQKYLEENGIIVKRYFNSDVQNNMELVLISLLNLCKKLDK